ncbi:hypothetical protein P20652_0562 [Pseudoalteromonas sp. BSi20652]|nr:hypothetical protein P20652_0562 [Pseudoalteromonas sp. BSi20652]
MNTNQYYLVFNYLFFRTKNTYLCNMVNSFVSLVLISNDLTR